MKLYKIISVYVIANLLILMLFTGCEIKWNENFDARIDSNYSFITYWSEENTDENKIYFSYPQFEEDTRRSVKINELISDFVESSLQDLCFGGFNGSLNNLNKSWKWDNDDYTTQAAYIEFEVLRNDPQYLSIKFEGLYNYKMAAHPINYFNSLIINIGDLKLISLSDLYTIDASFVELVKKKFKEQIRIGLAQKSNVLPNEILEVVEYELSSMDDEFILKALQQADRNNGYGFHSFMTEEGVGISIPLSHALGDHFEIMFNYAELDSFLKI